MGNKYKNLNGVMAKQANQVNELLKVSVPHLVGSMVDIVGIDAPPITVTVKVGTLSWHFEAEHAPEVSG